MLMLLYLLMAGQCVYVCACHCWRFPGFIHVERNGSGVELQTLRLRESRFEPCAAVLNPGQVYSLYIPG